MDDMLHINKRHFYRQFLPLQELAAPSCSEYMIFINGNTGRSQNVKWAIGGKIANRWLTSLSYLLLLGLLHHPAFMAYTR